MRKKNNPNILTKLPELVFDSLKYNITKKYKVLNPSVLQFNVISRCNTQCVMCNIWKNKESRMLSLDEIEEILSDPLFRDVQYLNITGGEPTMREDLFEIVKIACEKMPKLKKLSFPTNGIMTKRVVKTFEDIARFCEERNLWASVRISIDGVGDVHDTIRGIPKAYDKAMDSALQLKQVAREVLFDVGIGATISPSNAADVENLRRVADELDLDLVFVIATLSDSYYDNADLSDHLVFSENQKKELIDFLQKEKKGRPLVDEMAYYYDEACKYLDGDHRRTMPCPFQDQGFLIDSDGQVHYCPNSDSIGHLDDRRASEVYFDPSNLRYRERVREERCPTCQMSCYVGVGLQKSFVPFFKYQIKRAMRHLLNGAKGKKSSTIR